MAYVEENVRADGGTSCLVRWRLGGSRTGRRQSETFGAGTDAQNRARAEGFRAMVAAAGEFWPEGWVKGRGFVRTPDAAAAIGTVATAPRSVQEVGLE